MFSLVCVAVFSMRGQTNRPIKLTSVDMIARASICVAIWICLRAADRSGWNP